MSKHEKPVCNPALQEQLIASQWAAMRLKEMRKEKPRNSKPGPHGTVREAILEVLDRDMTCGDIQTALKHRKGITMDRDAISAHVCQMANIGTVRRVEKVKGMSIWARPLL